MRRHSVAGSTPGLLVGCILIVAVSCASGSDTAVPSPTTVGAAELSTSTTAVTTTTLPSPATSLSTSTTSTTWFIVETSTTTMPSASTTEVVDGEDMSAEEPDCNVYEEDCGSPTPCCDLVTPSEYLALLTIAEEGPRDGYNRDDWSHWHIKEWSGCSSREEVLVRTAIGDISRDRDDSCKVADGWWYSEYDRTWISESSEIEIDHIVALSEAHDSGASEWTPDQRERFANDLQNLVAVSSAANQSKDDRDAAGWRPHEEVWCSFAYTVVEVKANYGLTVDPAEHAALTEMIDTCVPPMSESYNWWRLRNGAFYDYSDRSRQPPITD